MSIRRQEQTNHRYQMLLRRRNDVEEDHRLAKPLASRKASTSLQEQFHDQDQQHQRSFREPQDWILHRMTNELLHQKFLHMHQEPRHQKSPLLHQDRQQLLEKSWRSRKRRHPSKDQKNQLQVDWRSQKKSRPSLDQKNPLQADWRSRKKSRTSLDQKNPLQADWRSRKKSRPSLPRSEEPAASTEVQNETTPPPTELIIQELQPARNESPTYPETSTSPILEHYQIQDDVFHGLQIGAGLTNERGRSALVYEQTEWRFVKFGFQNLPEMYEFPSGGNVLCENDTVLHEYCTNDIRLHRLWRCHLGRP